MPMQKSPSNRSSGGISPRVTRNNSKRLSETSNGKAKRQKVAEITVMGGPVKRNMNAYMHFSSSVRKAIVEEIGTKDFKSVATAVKGRWDKLTEEEKKKFQDLANADKLRYKWMELLSHCFVGRDNSRLDLDEETMKELVDDLLAMPATNAGANKWNCVSIFFVAIMRAEPRIKHYFVHQGGTNVVVTALQMVKDKLVKGRDQGIEDLALAALYCTSQLPIVLNTLRTHKDLAKTVKEISKLPEQFGNLKGHAESIIADWKSMTGIKNSLPGQSPGSNRSAESPSNSANPCAMTPENEAARTKVIDVLTKSLDSTDGIAAEKYPRAARAIERELIKAYGMGSKYMDQARALQTNLRNNEPLRKDIFTGSVPVARLVHMNSFEMARDELKEQRKIADEEHFKREVFDPIGPAVQFHDRETGKLTINMLAGSGPNLMENMLLERLHSANVEEEEVPEEISTPTFRGEASPTVFM